MATSAEYNHSGRNADERDLGKVVLDKTLYKGGTASAT
jgi:hypothetical protein